MGRVVPLRPARKNPVRSSQNGQRQWDSSFTIMEGAQRMARGVRHCRGRLLFRHLGGDDLEIVWLDGQRGTTHSTCDIAQMTAEELVEELHRLMFRG